MIRRDFIFSVLATAVATTGLGGCVTFKLIEPEKYDEQVSSLLISQDGKRIIIMTKQYHYIFDAPSTVVASVKSDYRAAITASFSDFDVNADREISGRVSLYIAKPNQETLQAAIKDGYTKTEYGLIFDSRLKGLRYPAGDVFPAQSYQLNKSYVISVTAEKSKAQKARNLLISPVTIAVDGVILLFGIPVVLLMLATSDPPFH